MKISGAIFDFDGTLADSMAIWDNLGEFYLRQKSIEPEPDLRGRLQSMTLKELSEYFCEHYGAQPTPQQVIDEIWGDLERYYTNDAPLKPGVREFLRSLREQGVKIAVATASPHAFVEPAMKRNGIFEYMDAIVSNDDVGCGKTRPDVYLRALSEIGTPMAETPVFEDAYYALSTAKKAGFPMIGVYDDTEPRQSEMQADSDFFFPLAADSLSLFSF